MEYFVFLVKSSQLRVYPRLEELWVSMWLSLVIISVVIFQLKFPLLKRCLTHLSEKSPLPLFSIILPDFLYGTSHYGEYSLVFSCVG